MCQIERKKKYKKNGEAQKELLAQEKQKVLKKSGSSVKADVNQLLYEVISKFVVGKHE